MASQFINQYLIAKLLKLYEGIVYIFTRNKKEEGCFSFGNCCKMWPNVAERILLRSSFLGTDVTWNCPIRGGTKFTVIKTTVKHATSHESLIPAILWLNTTGKEEDKFSFLNVSKVIIQVHITAKVDVTVYISLVRSSFLKKRQFTHRLTYLPPSISTSMPSILHLYPS